MKVDKKKVVATIGALGLTMGVLAGCGHAHRTEYVKVVDSQGHVQYIDEDDYDNYGGSGFFILYSSWNGHNHTRLKSSTGFKHKIYSKKPTVTSGKNKTTTTKSTTSAKSSSSKSISLTKSSGAKSSSAKSSGFGSGRSGGFGG